MDDPVDEERLARLEARIKAAKGEAEAETPKADGHYTQAQAGWRMVTELVTGIVIGFGIGYGLDSLFGTMPIFLVLFVLLGFAAGVRVMLRTAQEIQGNHAATAARDDEGEQTWRKK